MKRIMTEATLKKIVYEAAMSILESNIRNQMAFGTKGALPTIPTSTLFDDVPKKVVDAFEKAKNDRSARIPNKLLSTSGYLGNTLIWKIYQQYYAAMSRHRNPVNFGTFYTKLKDGWMGGQLSYFEQDGNYLIGTERQGYFLCIYLAPKNVGMGMFKLIKEVCEYNNVIFAVTLDLANMLERLGCPKYNNGEILKVKHNGRMVDKQIYGSTQEAADKGAQLMGLFKESDNIKNKLKKAAISNPLLAMMAASNPQLVKNLMNNPDFIQKSIDDPTFIDKVIANPALINQFLSKTSLMKENKRQRNGRKL